MLNNLKGLNIGILTNSSIERMKGEKVFLSGGEVFERAMVIWAAGVKTAGFVQAIQAEKNLQGRLKVDEFLRLNEYCFVAGDAAYFSYQGTFLRMAVQFALSQGECAAENVIRSISGRALRGYKPRDLGYIIPMANNRSWGKVFGLKLGGVLPTVLHFLMCLYRLPGLKNKFGMIRDLVMRGSAQ